MAIIFLVLLQAIIVRHKPPVAGGEWVNDSEALTLSAVGSPDEWTLGSGSTKVIACQTPDDDNTTYINTGTTAGLIQMFALTDPAEIGADDPIDSVKVRFRYIRAGTPGSYVRCRLVTGDGTLNGTAVQAGASYANRTEKFDEKPGGGAWTLSALNGLTAGVEFTSGNKDMRVTTIEVIAYYRKWQ